jgi:hypothetical protein
MGTTVLNSSGRIFVGECCCRSVDSVGGFFMVFGKVKNTCVASDFLLVLFVPGPVIHGRNCRI